MEGSVTLRLWHFTRRPCDTWPRITAISAALVPESLNQNINQRHVRIYESSSIIPTYVCRMLVQNPIAWRGQPYLRNSPSPRNTVCNSPHPPATIPTDALFPVKRRFIRQNRELARINAAQAIQLRALEAETSRLLTENIELRERLIHLERESKRPLVSEEVEEGTPYDRLRATKPDREVPEGCLETINEEKSPVLSRSTFGITLARKPIRKPRLQKPSTPELPAPEAPTPELPALEVPALEVPVPQSPAPASPGHDLLAQGPPMQEPPVQQSPVREPLAPKTRRAARVSYAEPSLKKKMRRSDIFANAVTG
jgi:Shugoshin N-terminal coiled-coil region/Shugoshin C terminus